MSKTAIVTGASGGIGAEVVAALVGQGHRVLATDLSAAALKALAAQRGWKDDRVATRALDVRDAEAWAAAVDDLLDRWGRLDLLYNVAGYLKPGAVHQVDPQEIDRHLDVNAKGVMLGTRAAARVMAGQGAGHVVTIGSLASLAPVPGIGLYTASKYAVRGYCLAAAQELAPLGVAVTLICPDAVQTRMLDKQLDYAEAALTFSGTQLTPQGVAEVVTGPRVLVKRPLEVWLPTRRGVLARVADLVPRVNFALGGLLARRGRAKQEALKRGG